VKTPGGFLFFPFHFSFKIFVSFGFWFSSFFLLPSVLSACAESTQRHPKEGDFDFPLFGNSP
jgi:hypothetical protein